MTQHTAGSAGGGHSTLLGAPVVDTAHCWGAGDGHSALLAAPVVDTAHFRGRSQEVNRGGPQRIMNSDIC